MLKPTETSKKVKVFGKKNAKVFGKNLQNLIDLVKFFVDSDVVETYTYVQSLKLS